MFHRAIERGNPPVAEMTAREMGRVTLAEALELVGLIAQKDPRRKAYRPDRPVGIAAVRHLYGVVERERASHGVIATTSRFTRGAKAEASLLKYRVTLADFEQVLAWVAEYRRLKRDGQSSARGA